MGETVYQKKKALAKSSFKSKKQRERIADTLSFITLILIAAIVMLPLWWMVRSSLMKSLDIFRWPPQFFPSEWLFSNYNIKPTTFDFWQYLCAAAL